MNKMQFVKWLVLLLLVLAGIFSALRLETTNSDAPYPNKPITLIVAYGAGGVTDLGARLFQPYLEQELGVSVRIVNINGKTGWVGWRQLLSASNDGYTLAFINTPSLITGYLNPHNKWAKNLDDFSLIANQVIDYGAIAIRPDETRFTTIRELISYATTHEVTTTSTGIASDDHLVVLKLNKALGTNFIPVHAANTGRLKHGVIGGHIDVYFGNVGELTLPHKTNELRLIALLAPNRFDFLPNVPTFEEAMGVQVYSLAARGIAGPPGLPAERKEFLTAAFVRAMQNEEFKAKMAEAGLVLQPMNAQDFRYLLEKEESDIRGVSSLLE